MKRDHFFKQVGIATAMLALPVKSWARLMSPPRTDKGFLVKSGEDRFNKPITLFEGDVFTTKVSTKDSDGSLYIFDSLRIKKGGPAMHFHYSQDEIWKVTEGEFLIKVGEQVFQAKAGDTIFGPKGVPHSFSKTSEGPARVTITFQPAGLMEEFFIAVSQGKLKNTTPEQQQEMRKKHGFESVGEGVGYQKKF